MEFLLHWQDGRGQGHQVLLKRRVPVAGLVQVPLAGQKAGAGGAGATGDTAASGGAYAWEIRGDEPRKLNPTWQMASDGERFMVRVTVEDGVKSYWPRMMLVPGQAGGWLMSDAVSFAWAADAQTPNESVRRIWALPFGPKGVELWTNSGVGDKQTPLLRLDEKAGITAELTTTSTGYEVTLILPRELVFGDLRPATLPAVMPATAASAPATTLRVGDQRGDCNAATAPAVVSVPVASAIVNVSVYDNDEGVRTWVRSSSKEALGPAGWAKVELMSRAEK